MKTFLSIMLLISAVFVINTAAFAEEGLTASIEEIEAIGSQSKITLCIENNTNNTYSYGAVETA